MSEQPDDAAQPASSDDDAPTPGADVDRVREAPAPVVDVALVRRAPRYRAFALAGALAAALAAVVVVLALGRRDDVAQALVVTVGAGAALGALVGAGVAVVLDRRS